ncbi:hypothetical protein D3C75_1258200 [compost metagenome]
MYRGNFFINGFGVFSVLMWLISVVACIYAFVLLVKLARRGIIALDLYIYAKNREIRDRYESADRKDQY